MATTSADASQRHAMRHVRAERVAGDEHAPAIDRVVRLDVVDDGGQVLDVEHGEVLRVRVHA